MADEISFAVDGVEVTPLEWAQQATPAVIAEALTKLTTTLHETTIERDALREENERLGTRCCCHEWATGDEHGAECTIFAAQRERDAHRDAEEEARQEIEETRAAVRELHDLVCCAEYATGSGQHDECPVEMLTTERDTARRERDEAVKLATDALDVFRGHGTRGVREMLDALAKLRSGS